MDQNYSPPQTISSFDRALMIGIGLNFGFALTEAMIGWRVHSLALLSDAGHNFSDVASLVIALMALRLSRKAEDTTFTFGYRKATILASLVNSILLILAVVGILYESVQRIIKPEIIEGRWVMIIAFVGIIVNGSTAWLMKKDSTSDLNAKGAYIHLLADALVSVGVVLSGALMSIMEWYWLDPIISIIIALVILYSIGAILSESIRLSLDAVPQGVSVDAVRTEVEALPNILMCTHIHIWAMSTSENAMTAQIQVADHIDLRGAIVLVEEAKERIRQSQNIHHITIELL